MYIDTISRITIEGDSGRRNTERITAMLDGESVQVSVTRSPPAQTLTINNGFVQEEDEIRQIDRQRKRQRATAKCTESAITPRCMFLFAIRSATAMYSDITTTRRPHGWFSRPFIQTDWLFRLGLTSRRLSGPPLNAIFFSRSQSPPS